MEITRRTAAWSVPLIALAVAAPAAAASTPPPSSNVRIIWNNFGISNRGKELDAGIQFPYVDWRNTVTMAQIVLAVTVPKAYYTGAYNIAEGAFTGSTAHSAGDNWIITFTFSHVLTQSQSTGNLRVIFTTIPNDPDKGAVSGTPVQGVAYGIDSTGAITQNIVSVSRA